MEGACLALGGCAFSHLGRGSKRKKRAPELRNVILPTRHSSFSLITSLKIFRSTWKGEAPLTAESALASRLRSTCSKAQSHSMVAGLTWLSEDIMLGTNEDRGWENEGFGISFDGRLSTTVEPSCGIGSQENVRGSSHWV